MSSMGATVIPSKIEMEDRVYSSAGSSRVLALSFSTSVFSSIYIFSFVLMNSIPLNNEEVYDLLMIGSGMMVVFVNVFNR